MKYAFLGAGNLGGAMIEGMVNGGINRSDIYVCDKYTQTDIVDKYGVNGAASIEALTDAADIVFVAVKPNDCAAAFAAVGARLRGSQAVVSTAAGVTLSQIEEMLGTAANIIRVMPNINARYGYSATAVCPCAHTDEASIEAVLACLRTFGEIYMIEEDYFGTFSALASCSPAFTYMYIDALARAALKLGLNKKQAEQIAAQSVAGSAIAFAKSGKHPYELVDAVCSPGGMTVEGVAELMDSGFVSAAMRAVEVSALKDKSLLKRG